MSSSSSSALPLNLSQDQAKRLLDKAKAEQARRSLHEFVRQAWHVLEPAEPFVDNWHIGAICEHLEAASRRQLRRLIVNIAPRHTKSLLFSVCWNAWHWATTPSERFFYTTYRNDLSLRDANNCRTLIKSPWYQRNWGDKFKIVSDQDAKYRFETDKRGSRFSTSVEGGMTGEGGDCIPAGVMVATQSGDIAIDALHALECPPKVLTWNIGKGRHEYRSIQATRKVRSSKPLYRLRTSSGRTLVCTEDHRVLTADGFRQAKVVRSGDFLAVQGNGQDPVLMVRGHEREEAARGHQDSCRWCSGVLLRDQVQGGQGGVLGQAVEVRDLRSGCGQAPDVLWAEVLAKPGQAGDSGDVLLVPDSVQGQAYTSVLQPILRVQGARGEDDRVRELELPSRGVVLPGGDAQAGPLAVRGMQVQGIHGSGGGWQDHQQPTSPSHQRNQAGQPTGELGHTVRVMPPDAPQGLEEVVLVERLCGQSHEVYDLQVEGNHNFYAGGVLVHNCLVLDDPHNAREAESEVERQNVKDFVDRAWSSRVNNPRTSVKVVVMQRLHEDDVTAHLLRKEAGWERLVLPTEYVPTTRVFFNGKRDPRTVEGQLLWPQRFGEKEVAEAKADLGDYGFAAQHQQSPSARSAGMFNTKKLREAMVKFRPTQCVRMRGWDLAATVKKDSKRTAGVLMSKDEHGAYYIEHVTLGKWTPDERNATILGRTKADGHEVMVKVEHEGGSSGEDQAIGISRLLAGYSVEFIKVSGDKAVRADPFAAQCNAGNVHIVDDGTWDVETYLSELAGFPEGVYKDQVDASSLAFNQLAPMEVSTEAPEGSGVRPRVPSDEEMNDWRRKLPGDSDWMSRI